MSARADNLNSLPDGAVLPQGRTRCTRSQITSVRRCSCLHDEAGHRPGPGGAVRCPAIVAETGRTHLSVLGPTPPCSWRWKMTYTISTGITVMTTEANMPPQSTL